MAKEIRFGAEDDSAEQHGPPLTPLEKATLEKLGLSPDQVFDKGSQQEEDPPAETLTPGAAELLEKIQSGDLPKIDLGEEGSGKKDAAPPPPQGGPESPGAAPAAAEMQTMAAEPKFCQHCGWDLSIQDTISIEEDDKRAYLAALLGGKPFVKSYTLFGGQAVITLRTLSPKEVDVCRAQTWIDHQNGELPLTPDYIDRLERYLSILQLVSIRGELANYTFPKSLNDWKIKVPSGTPLPEIVRRVTAEVLVSDSAYRLLIATTRQFNRLVAKLEANAANPDFWKATGSPG